ncbi:MAG: hypothetical protein H0U39_02565 [Segetibacter sp.]|jgi:hypothetical protein|nr:hypothetical protein [Segetibacter sp.]
MSELVIYYDNQDGCIVFESAEKLDHHTRLRLTINRVKPSLQLENPWNYPNFLSEIGGLVSDSGGKDNGKSKL